MFAGGSMKIGIVDNNFVMQSFGVGRNVKKLSDKKTKYKNSTWNL